MLTIYRRHVDGCKHADNRVSMKCRCALWCTGTLEGHPYRRSLKTRSFERAQKIVRNIEDGKEVVSAPTIKEAVAKFLADAHSRKLEEETIKKYRLVLTQLEAFAGKKELKDITVDFAREFRGSWKDGAISSSKKLERLRTFCRFLVVSGWLKTNPAASVDMPKIDDVPTLPFEDSEVARTLEAAKDKRWHALIQVMRWSGLRISDAMQLRKEHVDASRIFLRMEKTKVPVWVPVPDFVIQELSRLETYGGYFFWKREGNSKVASATGNARRALRDIFTAAKIQPMEKVTLKHRRKKTMSEILRSRAHPHQFRDTFAVSLLNAGVPIETVSILLGHKSVRVTQRSYSPWVSSRQLNLERAVAATWPTAKLELVKH